MNFATVVLLGVVNCAVSAAQTSDEYKACSNAAGTQAALHRCADEELRRADRDLNEAYRRLISVAKDKPDAVVKVRAMERAWMAYRDAFVEALYPAPNKQAAYGTMFVVEALLIRARLTCQQTAELTDLTAQKYPPMK
jgi:uncharacterized protein YecT (DUF1311 family)